MNLNIDEIISFFQKYSDTEKNLDEQDAAGTGTGGATTGGGSGKTPKKWESGRVLGKTYMNDPKYKWDSGRKLGKTYMNDPKYVWKSDRAMGKTGGSDYA